MTISTLPLSYCTNVHPGRTLLEVLDGITQHTAAVRRQTEFPVAAGLWLSQSVITELHSDDQNIERLAQTLWEHDLCCYTLNAFPFGDFHSERVKEQVYLPDWTTSERYAYTRDCAHLLAKLLPEGQEGTISTVPLGGRMNPSGPDFHATCFHNLIKLARYLKDLHQESGRMIRLAVEPEPFCHMSSVPDEAVPQFRTLFEMAEALGVLEAVQTHIGVCFDVCHQAVLFEHIPQSMDQLNDVGARINKIHITNALELPSPATNKAGRQELARYVEARYLHQTYARHADGSVTSRVDLTIEDIERQPPDEFMTADAWRVHFHVPVYAEELGPLRTTREELKAALLHAELLAYAPHLEVETYTWPVMPGDRAESVSLADQIARELQAASELVSAARR